MHPDSRHFACILAGGSGERFWPMSRTRTPKHLLRLFSDRTLLEETVARLEGVVRPENILILTNEAQREGVRAVLPFLRPEQIVAEPAKRDTGPAAALATGYVRARCPDGVVAILASDALIRNRSRFAAQLTSAFEWAAGQRWPGSAGTLLTFAVPPTHPSTGFGYLELGDELARSDEGSRIRRVRRFVEKPDAATAERYVASGQFGWNACLFVWGVEAFLAEADRQSPELAAFIREFPAGDPAAYLADRFPALPKRSVDYAIMEHALAVATVVAEFDWDDVGTWGAVPAHLGSDAAGNAVRGPVVAVDSTGNLAVSNGRLIALCGVMDLVVVETADAILVCHRDAVQSIKQLQALLPKDVV
jgi:mannose-1-phosphate guanylyltransferase